MTRGFTLIELIIVVIIVGVLASLAMPMYTGVLEKSRSAEGINILSSIHNAEMLYYAEHGFYATSIDDLGVNLLTPQYFNPGVLFVNSYPDLLAMISRKGSSAGKTGYNLSISLQTGTIICRESVGFGADTKINCPN